MKTILLALCALPLLAVGATPPPIDLPEGLVAEVAAAPPLVRHPIMAALGKPGALFVGDAAGTNLNKAGLEKDLPNRVLLLQDTNHDGVYDRSTVFADRMTFPQGGVWLDGSFYVASPPGLWKLTDADDDGVAERREMIVGGFEFTGNAADVHGPFLHPNGRLYWCHGRKGHEVKQKDGTLVHAGLASGIWSCQPDGSDVRWHALSCADNPTEIDFTPEGEIVGTVNLFYSGPRGDTLIHWLRGGVYPREDQLKAIQGLPRTLDVMPVMHNFGHVGVSGCAFYRSGTLNPDWRGNLFVVHFNTQRITRMELTPDGATYRVAQREFLKLNHPDAHLTDVLEDRDGSLLVIDTGGWFRSGCPSSVTAKPDVAGAVYRVRAASPARVEPWGAVCDEVWTLARKGDPASVRRLVELLGSKNTRVARAAANALARSAKPEVANGLRSALNHQDPGVQLAAAHALGELASLDSQTVSALIHHLDGDIDRSVEHQAMHALLRANQPVPLLQALRTGKPALQRRALVILNQLPASTLAATDVVPLLAAGDVALAGAAAAVAAQHQDWVPAVAEYFSAVLKETVVSPVRLALLEQVARPWLAETPVRDLVSTLLASPDFARQRAAWRILAASGSPKFDARWLAPLQAALANSPATDLPLVLDAVARLHASELDATLKQFSTDPKRPLALRLKALSASFKHGTALPGDSFTMLLGVLGDPASAAARLESARLLAVAKLSREQLLQLAPAITPLGPLELREVLKVFRPVKEPAVGNAFAAALKVAPALAGFQESEIRSLFGNLPPECYTIVEPALRELALEDDARHRKLETLPNLAATRGHPAEGRKIFESGKGACSACHRIGDVGNLVGPNLSAIGQIRSERDLMESIFFPSATLARDYESHTIETADGQSVTGVIRRNLPDSLVIADASGQERTLARAQITALQTLPTSLMPAGLDRTLTEAELLDLVAYLRSRK